MIDCVLYNTFFQVINQFILGGWGVKIFQKRRPIYRASYKLFYETEHQLEYGFDQAILSEIIWPLTFKDSVCFCT